jgi:hypothetical protein
MYKSGFNLAYQFFTPYSSILAKIMVNLEKTPLYVGPNLVGLSSFFFTPRELKILRNEIFGRHDYIFKTSDMKNYFSAQSWYRPGFDNVDDQLTDLERLNLQLITK